MSESLVRVVVGGLWGSCSKGAVCSYFARPGRDPAIAQVAVRVGGSQAGHTVIDARGVAWKFRHLPVATVIDPSALLIIAAGSEVDLEVLNSEVEAAEAAGYSVRPRLHVDGQATVIRPEHQLAEHFLIGSIGSTGKGVGGARAARVMRRATIVKDWPDRSQIPGGITNTASYLNNLLRIGVHVTIEGVQGYGLGLHAGYYPKCSSSDARAIDFLAMVGLSPWSGAFDTEVWTVFRPYPIRVAGPSGPLYRETSWEALGLPEERTTVTQNIRRVGHWDAALARKALKANGWPNVRVAMAMCDHLDPNIRDKPELSDVAEKWLAERERELDCKISLVGTGPSSYFKRSS